MDNVYEFHEVTAAYAKFGITVRRKPSQIPYSIDHGLALISGHVELDGPHNRVTYLFTNESRAAAGEKFLQSCGWRRAS